MTIPAISAKLASLRVNLQCSVLFARFRAAFGRNARVGALSTRMAASIPKVPFDGAAVTGPSGPTLPGDGDLDFLEAKP